jgi:WD40 repeat protein
MELSDFERYIQKRLAEQARREGAEDYDTSRQNLPKYLLAGLTGTERFGHFELHSQLGIGGFGVVFLTRDTRTDRMLALKLPLPQVLLSPKAKKMFERDGRTGLMLDHPGIVKVHEFGEVDGIPYIASEYVEGPTLERWLNKRCDGISPDVAVEIVGRIADALEHAHAKGVVHRDLKPTNILLMRGGGDEKSLASHQPMITDFGLARVRDELGQTITATGAIFGSIPFMAPEQITGPKGSVGPCSDIYALGVILYHMLTGSMPFPGATGEVMMRKIVNDPIDPVRSRRPSVPVDLATVCERCLRKKPYRRFASAAELRDDLERFRRGERILSCPMPRWEKAANWSQRNPAATVTMVAAAAFMSLQSYQVRQLRRVNAELTVAKALAERKEREAEALVRKSNESERLANERERIVQRFYYARRLIDAQAAIADHNALLAQQILTEIDPGEADREFVWNYLWRKSREKMEWIPLKDRTADLDRIWNPGDGRWLSGKNSLGKLQIFDTTDWSMAGEIDFSEHPKSEMFYVSLSPDGRRIYATNYDPPPTGTNFPVAWRVAAWDTVERRTLNVENIPPIANIVGVKLIPDSDTLLVLGQHLPYGAVRMRENDLANRTSKEWPLGDDYAVIAFSRDGKKFLGSHLNGNFYLVDARDPRVRKELKYTGEPDWTTMTFHEENGLVLIRSVVRIKGQEHWRIVAWKSSFEGSGEPVLAHAVPYDRHFGFWPLRAKNMVLVGKPGVGAGLLDLESGETTPLELDPADPGFGTYPGIDLLDQHVVHDGTLLTFANQKGFGSRCLAWDLKTKKQVIDPSIHDAFRAYESAGREFLYGVDERKLFRWWPKRRFMQPESLDGHDFEAWSATFSPNGDTIFTGSDASGESPTFKAWDRATGKMLWAVKAHNATVTVMAMHPDGKVVATGSLLDSANVRLWETATGQMTADLKGIDLAVRALRFSPDGTRLAAGDKKGRCVVWDVASGKVLHDFRVGADRVLCLAFSADGRTLISGTEDGWIRAWNLADMKLARELYTGVTTQGLAIGPDTKTAAGIGVDGRIFYVNFETSENLRFFEMPSRKPWAITMFPDGKTLAAGDKQGNVMMWDMETGTEKFRTKAHDAQINSLTVSPDGKTLVSCAHDGNVRLWHAGPEF